MRSRLCKLDRSEGCEAEVSGPPSGRWGIPDPISTGLPARASHVSGEGVQLAFVRGAVFLVENIGYVKLHF